ncbi:tetratricopeptide repeat protein [Chryseobacterium sp. 2987]|uniref:tetratricopeptide repeat protein n=1 Tax=Chryseobacterium sp. 2987 TaxID=2817767 RepID=UPI00286364A1|nr:tetratricopeptide repeat protein [Chryseobacterium sp. 2987]MDR6921256.1 AraC-like DNA-binding protein [Chryseobacterium sp. 2987]
MNKLFLPFVLLLYIAVNAQDTLKYNTIYTKTYLETSQKNFSQAVKTADSLYTVSASPYFQVKSLMLLASLYQQSGDLKKSIGYAHKTEVLLEDSEDYLWRAKVSGFLATQYRLLKLYSQSKKYSLKTFNLCDRIENKKVANMTRGMAMQELAYYEQEREQFHKSNQYILKAQKYFNESGQKTDFFSANNEQLLGLNYYYLKNQDEALTHYQKAMGLSKELPESHITGLIYNGLAQVCIEKGDLKNAKKYLDLAEKISGTSGFLQLKNAVYNTAQQYYLKTNDVRNLTKVAIKKDSVNKKITEKSNAFINESYTRLYEQNNEISEGSFRKDVIIFIGAVLLILIIVGFMLYTRIKHKKNLQRFNEILKQVNKERISEKEPVEEAESFSKDIEENERRTEQEYSVTMTTATERKILIKLYEFERSDIFTNNNISLPYLASLFETNTKYLSFIINTHKKKDFNNYINELRVYYVIKKLKINPKYRKYKIAVLAEEAGFSSQNKFATIFKKVTSMSPSLFIKHLEEEKVK